MEKEYISKAKVKERGWTDKLIKKFMGLSDKEKKNPVFPSASPMQLYSLSRIKKIERSNSFIDEKKKSEIRKKASRKAITTKKKKIKDYIENLNITIKKIPLKKIKKNAIFEYNKFKNNMSIERGSYNFEEINGKEDIDFLYRIYVNYIRHNLTIYEDKLKKIFGKTGKIEAYNLLNKKIYSIILKTYPTLSGECKKQMQRKINGDLIWKN